MSDTDAGVWAQVNYIMNYVRQAAAPHSNYRFDNNFFGRYRVAMYHGRDSTASGLQGRYNAAILGIDYLAEKYFGNKPAYRQM